MRMEGCYERKEKGRKIQTKSPAVSDVSSGSFVPADQQLYPHGGTDRCIQTVQRAERAFREQMDRIQKFQVFVLNKAENPFQNRDNYLKNGITDIQKEFYEMVLNYKRY